MEWRREQTEDMRRRERRKKQMEFLLLKFLNVEFIVCTGFEAENKKKKKKLRV